MKLTILAVLGAASFAMSPAGLAQRLAVLKQIDLPHPYYYREMYLPQLTSGPTSEAWSPDSSELVYSMAGTLWRQAIGSRKARQLTAAAAYDYQPDWSADGRWIIYSSYLHDTVELWCLDTSSGATRPLLQNGAVNVDARFSPDGKRIAFVSSAFKGHFHIFVGDFSDGQLTHVEQLTPEHVSALPRYYYSPTDHEISPVWSRDGKEIVFVSNRNHLYGTGGFWRMAAQAGAEAREIHYEETNWRARPDFSPDGNRLVFASYSGRSWHNLWVMPAQGGDTFAIGYGDWDQVSPRWSPDGTRVAFISNRNGNTEIHVQRIPGGDVQPLLSTEREYLHPTGRLHISLRSSEGDKAAARVSVTDSSGIFHAPSESWIHGDDGFDRKERPFEAHYFHVLGETTLDVPAGVAHIEIMHGFERSLERHEVAIAAGQTTELDSDLREDLLSVPAPGRWVSGDVHVHMNYGGAYRNTPAHLLLQARAENLNVIESLIVNKEQRFPDIAYSGVGLDPVSRPDTLIVHGQEYHTSYWGHLGLLGIQGSVILPGYVGYPNTAASSLSPSNADVADLAHAKRGLVGYVHPFDEAPHPQVAAEKLTNELPVDVALGKVDYMEILGFSDHRTTADVWYRLLNLGFRIPAAGGTDAMANFASLRGPVGMNRVYARIPDASFTSQDFTDAIRRGRTFATNGPLLGLMLGDAVPGDDLHLESARKRVPYRARLQSIVPVDHLDLVCDGKLARALIHGKAAHADAKGSVELRQSGWCVLRAYTDGARYPVLDNYVYATTSPVYVDVAHQKPRSPADAEFFATWIDRVREATVAYPDWNSAGEKQHVLGQLAAAKKVYTDMR